MITTRDAVEQDVPEILAIYNDVIATSTAVYRDDPGRRIPSSLPRMIPAFSGSRLTETSGAGRGIASASSIQSTSGPTSAGMVLVRC